MSVPSLVIPACAKTIPSNFPSSTFLIRVSILPLTGFTITSGRLRVTCTARLKLLLPITEPDGISSISNPSLVISTSFTASRFGIQEIIRFGSSCDGTSFRL